MKKSIIIELQDIIRRLQTYTYYTGEARKKSGFPLQLASDIQASDNDTIQLYDHIDNVCNEAAAYISRYLSLCNLKITETDDCNNSRSACFSVELPHNFPIECIEQLKTSIINYAVTRTAQQWLTQFKPDEGMYINNEVQSRLIQLREVLTQRNLPYTKGKRGKKILEI